MATGLIGTLAFAMFDDLRVVRSVQTGFVVSVRSGDTRDQSHLSMTAAGPGSRLPVVMSWANNRCQCQFVPVEPGPHTVRMLQRLYYAPAVGGGR